MKGKKILIVDDEPDVLNVLEKKLGIEGFEIIKADCGQTAIEKAAQEHPDMILLDIVLPDFDGSEVVQRIRTHPFLDKNIPILFLSGIVTGDTKEGLEVTVGGQTYPALPKPVTIGELLKSIKRLFPEDVSPANDDFPNV